MGILSFFLQDSFQVSSNIVQDLVIIKAKIVLTYHYYMLELRSSIQMLFPSTFSIFYQSF